MPSPRVKSPPWIIKSLITRWNLLPLYLQNRINIVRCKECKTYQHKTQSQTNYAYPSPSAASANSLKLRAVFGTVPLNKPISIRPAGSPPIVISKKTYGDNHFLVWYSFGSCLISNTIIIRKLSRPKWTKRLKPVYNEKTSKGNVMEKG